MAPQNLGFGIAIFCTVLSSVSAANCNIGQYRKAGDPSGQQISNALLGTNDATLDSVCNGGFPPGSDTIATFNTGSLIYNITRADASQPLQNCEAGFQDIIQQCIVNGNYWGGDWELDGDTYAIYDQSWPDHTLPAELLSSASAASATASSASSTGGAAAPTSQTVIVTTINGSPITETFLPTTVGGITQATTTSTTIDGVIIPLILGPLGVGFIPFVPPGGVPPVPDFTPPPAPDDGGGDDNPTTTPQIASSTLKPSISSSSAASSSAVITQDIDDGYNVGSCGYNNDAATRKTTFTTSSRAASSSSRSSTTAASVTPTPTPSSTSSSSTPAAAATSTSTTATAVFPSGTGISCGQSTIGGARLSDCLDALGSVEIPNDNTQICTNSAQSSCIASGDSVGGSPQVTTSSWCWVGGNSGCAVVIANKLSSFGFPGFSCVTGADLNIFIRLAANQCNNGLDAYAIAQGPNVYDSLCLTGSQDPGLCGA